MIESDENNKYSKVVNPNNSELNLLDLYKTLIRRKKLFFFSASSIFLISVISTAYVRIFKPVYMGNFSLLISDPLENQNNNFRRFQGDGLIEELAKNTTNADIPSLLVLMRSPILLSSLASKYDITPRSLSSRIRITVGGSGANRYERAKGILKITLISRNPKKDLSLLKDLSQTYLRSSLEQRQQRLADGLEFLNNQAPELEEKTSILQKKLAKFRQDQSILDPNIEAGSIKKEELVNQNLITNLISERKRLTRAREEIKNGNLSTRGFSEGINAAGTPFDPSRGEGLEISNAEQSLLKEMSNLQTKLAEYRSKFTPGSSVIKNVEAKLEQLKPMLANFQMKAVDTALSLNEAKLENAQDRKMELKEKFKKQPVLIKEYESLQQRLRIVQNNLSSLVSARENFQLQIAQTSVPWR